MNTCTHCHQYFRPKFPQAKLCYSCWQKRECAFLEYDSLLDQLADLKDRQQMGEFPTQIETIPAEKIRQMLSLCHPDRWQGTEKEGAANDATQWLLSLRSR